MKSQVLTPTCVQAGSALASLALLIMITLLTPTAQAQVYRLVGPDGKVSFSDQPPPVGSASKASAANTGSSSAGPAAGLPFELRQVATKFPVTLFTTENCAPCSAGRSMLTNRGIPFAEKTIATSEDSEALKRLSGAASLPLLTVGSQHLKGYSDAEWTQFLDAAGYPASSALPAAYRRPAATPLVLSKPGPTAAAPPSAEAPPKPAASPVVNAPASPANPAGIRF